MDFASNNDGFDLRQKMCSRSDTWQGQLDAAKLNPSCVAVFLPLVSSLIDAREEAMSCRIKCSEVSEVWLLAL